MVYTQRNPGDVPASVRNLLLSMKQLQEVLRQWSVNQATEGQVSDVFVRIGTDFHTTLHAFAYHHIDLSDIHSIPTDLRSVLEQCLAEDPSPQVLSVYMPEVRQVLYRLLKGLQARQEVWRSISGAQMPMIPPGYEQ
ncbi:bud site selection protein 6 [Moniliophthora roreri MCA 2997]|uniref:Bud site selection protein 6 n=2 Tax=Moniliophthora roreri TaxID=221103 RepID=V2X555_MONRO|nr:bud site selection protein 6 [Moniliophthora roreri MCA 2997]